MYRPVHFAVDDVAECHALIRAVPLGLLVTRQDGRPTADPVPFLLVEGGPHGTLQAHVARANPLWRLHDPDTEALVVFQAADHYVSPSWYATKRETHKVVPTWNYACVEAAGRLRIIDDPVWLADQIARLTDTHEHARGEPWAVSDAPAPFVEAQIRGIVGIEIEIARLTGKWKVSQNRPVADRHGVVDGLAAEPDRNAAPMIDMVRRKGGLDDMPPGST